MQHIKTQREIFKSVIKEEADDVYDFLQLAQWWRENYLRDIENKFTDKQNEELTKYLKQKLEWLSSPSRFDLESEFAFWVEKNRWYPLWMWEYSDISEWVSSWADDNWYGFLYSDDD